jgi:hypothetical protein
MKRMMFSWNPRIWVVLIVFFFVFIHFLFSAYKETWY